MQHYHIEDVKLDTYFNHGSRFLSHYVETKRVGQRKPVIPSIQLGVGDLPPILGTFTVSELGLILPQMFPILGTLLLIQRHFVPHSLRA